jgi:hypothetical protein
VYDCGSEDYKEEISLGGFKYRPHFSQNLPSGGFDTSQFGQDISLSNGVPQDLQKIAFSRFSNLHFGHSMMETKYK